MQKAHVESLRQ